MATLKVKVLLSFLRLAIVDKILKGKLIISGVTTQAAKLPNLPFTVAQLTAVNDDLDKKTQEFIKNVSLQNVELLIYNDFF